MHLRDTQRRFLRLLAVPGLVLSGACGAVPEPMATRLVDIFQSDAVSRVVPRRSTHPRGSSGGLTNRRQIRRRSPRRVGSRPVQASVT